MTRGTLNSPASGLRVGRIAPARRRDRARAATTSGRSAAWRVTTLAVGGMPVVSICCTWLAYSRMSPSCRAKSSSSDVVQLEIAPARRRLQPAIGKIRRAWQMLASFRCTGARVPGARVAARCTGGSGAWVLRCTDAQVHGVLRCSGARVKGARVSGTRCPDVYLAPAHLST